MQDDAFAFIDTLLPVLDRQLVLYEEVLTISRSQQAAIESDATSELMQCLANKQKRIMAIDALNTEAAPLLAQWEASHDEIPPERRRPVEERVETMRALLAQIVELEDAGQARLKGTQADMNQKMNHVQKGRALHKAYGVKRPPKPPRYKDTQG